MDNKKRTIVIALSMVLLIIGGGFLYAKLGKNYKIENESSSNESVKAIDFTVYDEDGKKVKLSDFYGKPIVLNFWASWCNPCKKEMIHFQKATDEFKDVEILMVNLTDGSQETVSSASSYLKENNFDMNVFFDKDLDATVKYQVFSIPRTVFIDKDGNVKNDYSGSIDEETLFDYINDLIK